MSRLFVIMLISSLLAACQNEPDTLAGTIAKLERGIKNAKPEKKEALIEAYESYVSTYPDRHDQNAMYLNKAAQLCVELNRIPKAIAILQNSIKTHYSGTQTLDNIKFLGSVYADKVKNENLAAISFQSGKEAFPSSKAFDESIDPAWPGIEERLSQLKDQSYDTTGINYLAVNDFINGSCLYAMIVPESASAAPILFEAARLANQTRTFAKALEMFDWISIKYPKFDKSAEVLFLSAFVLDRDLKRYDEARIKYESFLEKYPDNNFAKDVRFLLENLGVPPEEIVKRFEEMNQ